MQNVNGYLIKQVTVLSVNVGVCSLTYNGFRRQYIDIGKLLNGHFNSRALSRSEPPHQVGHAIFLVSPRLVDQRYEEVEGSRGCIDSV